LPIYYAYGCHLLNVTRLLLIDNPENNFNIQQCSQAALYKMLRTIYEYIYKKFKPAHVLRSFFNKLLLANAQTCFSINLLLFDPFNKSINNQNNTAQCNIYKVENSNFCFYARGKRL